MFGLNLSFLDEKVPKHRLALSVWVECKLFKGKSSKTGLKHRRCVLRMARAELLHYEEESTYCILTTITTVSYNVENGRSHAEGRV